MVEELRRTNEQLRGRFGEVMELPPLSLTTADDQTTFKGALNVFQQLLAGVDSVTPCVRTGGAMMCPQSCSVD